MDTETMRVPLETRHCFVVVSKVRAGVPARPRVCVAGQTEKTAGNEGTLIWSLSSAVLAHLDFVFRTCLG